MFLTSISSVGLREKEFILIGGGKSWTLFLEYLVGDWMSVEMFTKSLVKTLVISRCLAKLWPLSKKLDGAIIATPFKEISFFITFHVLFESFKLFGTNL